jgi:NAD(P)-dependent dehydrogenase (short-subunit alcohol dehydrogenase family)
MSPQGRHHRAHAFLRQGTRPEGRARECDQPGSDRDGDDRLLAAAVKQSAIVQTPLGRLAQADDVASVGCFLASEQARFITGEIVEVNGGFYFR